MPNDNAESSADTPHSRRYHAVRAVYYLIVIAAGLVGLTWLAVTHLERTTDVVTAGAVAGVLGRKYVDGYVNHSIGVLSPKGAENVA